MEQQVYAVKIGQSAGPGNPDLLSLCFTLLAKVVQARTYLECDNKEGAIAALNSALRIFGLEEPAEE